MGTVVWLTGLSGSGKTTIAQTLKKKLETGNKKILILDGDDVRAKLNRTLGFTREDIRENNRIIASLAKDKKKEYDFILIPVISPYREDRSHAKSVIGDPFLEIFVNCSLQECITKDVKGLYKKALAGEIPNFIGLSSTNPYEAPSAPDVEIKTNIMSVEQSVEKILSCLNEKGLV